MHAPTLQIPLQLHSPITQAWANKTILPVYWIYVPAGQAEQLKLTAPEMLSACVLLFRWRGLGVFSHGKKQFKTRVCWILGLKLPELAHSLVGILSRRSDHLDSEVNLHTPLLEQLTQYTYYLPFTPREIWFLSQDSAREYRKWMNLAYPCAFLKQANVFVISLLSSHAPDPMVTSGVGLYLVLESPVPSCP